MLSIFSITVILPADGDSLAGRRQRISIGFRLKSDPPTGCGIAAISGGSGFDAHRRQRLRIKRPTIRSSSLFSSTDIEKMLGAKQPKPAISRGRTVKENQF